MTSLPTLYLHVDVSPFLCRASRFPSGDRSDQVRATIEAAIARAGADLMAYSLGTGGAIVAVIGPYVEPGSAHLVGRAYCSAWFLSYKLDP